MYALVVLLSMLVTSTFVRGVRPRPARGGCPPSRSRSRCWSTRTTGGCSSPSARWRRSSRSWRVSADRRALVRDARARLRRSRRCSTCRGCRRSLSRRRHTGAPWAERRDLPGRPRRPALAAGRRGAGHGLRARRGAASALSTTRGRRAALAACARGARRSRSWASPRWRSRGSPRRSRRPGPNRYFAVFVGPLLLLGAAGLARGGQLGLVVLAILVAFWFDPRTGALEHKSNAHSRRASCAATASSRGDLVVSPTPSRGRCCTTTCPGHRAALGRRRWARSRTRASSTGATRSTA